MVVLSNEEFLSVYTGVLLAPSFDTVIYADEKIFGFQPYTATTIKCSRQFQKYIKEHRKDLVEAVEKLGRFKKDPNIPVIDQIKNYIKRFEEITGSNCVVVEKLEFKTDEKTREL